MDPETSESAPTVAKPESFTIQAYFQELQKLCDEILNVSVNEQNGTLMALSRQFCPELASWHLVIAGRGES